MTLHYRQRLHVTDNDFALQAMNLYYRMSFVVQTIALVLLGITGNNTSKSWILLYMLDDA